MTQDVRAKLARFALALPGDGQPSGQLFLPRNLDLDGAPSESVTDLFGYWVTGLTLSYVVGCAIAALPTFLWDPVTTSPPAVVTVSAGLVLGLVVGVVQWLILRRSLPGTSWWIALTALGMAAGTVARQWVLNAPDVLSVLYSATGILVTFQSTPLVVATCFQTLLLARWFDRVGVWIPIAVLGTFLTDIAANATWMTILRSIPAPAGLNGTWLYASHDVFVGLFAALVVGSPCGWLLAKWTAARRESRCPPSG